MQYAISQNVLRIQPDEKTLIINNGKLIRDTNFCKIRVTLPLKELQNLQEAIPFFQALNKLFPIMLVFALTKGVQKRC